MRGIQDEDAGANFRIEKKKQLKETGQHVLHLKSHKGRDMSGIKHHAPENPGHSRTQIRDNQQLKDKRSNHSKCVKRNEWGFTAENI